MGGFPVCDKATNSGKIGTAGTEIFRQNIKIALSPVLERFHLVYIDKCNPFTGLSTEWFYSNAKKERKFSTSPCAHINVKPLIIGTCFMSIFCRCRRGKEKKMGADSVSFFFSF